MCIHENDEEVMYFMFSMNKSEKMKYLNKGRNKNNFQTCRTVRDTLTVKKTSK